MAETIRISHDPEVCMGIGSCEAAAGDLFSLDADGTLTAAGEAPVDRLADVTKAVGDCPTGALSFLRIA